MHCHLPDQIDRACHPWTVLPLQQRHHHLSEVRFVLHRVCCTVGVSIAIAVPRSRRESFECWLVATRQQQQAATASSSKQQQQAHRPAQQRVRPAAARRHCNGGTRGADGLLLTRRDHHAAVGVVVVQLLDQREPFAVRSIRSTRLYTTHHNQHIECASASTSNSTTAPAHPPSLTPSLVLSLAV